MCEIDLLFFGERLRDEPLVAVERGHDLVDRFAPACGERHEHSPAIGAVCLTAQQLARFESLHYPGQGRRGDAGLGGKSAGIHLAPDAEYEQTGECTPAQFVLREHSTFHVIAHCGRGAENVRHRGQRREIEVEPGKRGTHIAFGAD